MSLNTQEILDKKQYLFACEAVGFLHNIGKLDDRFLKKGGNDYSYQNITDWRQSPNGYDCKPTKRRDLFVALVKECFKRNNLCFNKVHEETIDDLWTKQGKRRTALIVGFLESLRASERIMTRSLFSGYYLYMRSGMEGIDLTQAQLESFIRDYVQGRIGSAQGGSFADIPFNGKDIPWHMLLNLFWDDYHWCPRDCAHPTRDDNLTPWLGQDAADLSYFARIMAVCHEAISRGDKGTDDSEADRHPPASNIWTSVFGKERGEMKRFSQTNLHAKLQNSAELIELFKGTASDGELPINDVSLYDYCRNFGAFLKTAYARLLLAGDQPEPHELRWRLLYFRHDGLEWISRGGRLADAVAREKIWQDVIDNVAKLLETQFPVCSLIYRDTMGAFFLAPDVEGLLTLQPFGNSKNLMDAVIEAGLDASKGEIRISPQLSPPVKGYAAFISKWINDLQFLNPDEISMKNQWGNITHPLEVCTTCGLRPIAYNDEIAKRQRVCSVCLERRRGRSKQWQNNAFKNTIWLSELADENNRCALLVGSFALDGWLDGSLDGSLFQSLARKWEHADTDDIDGGPSFTRVRAVWETTQAYWEGVNAWLESDQDLRVSGRWEISLSGSVDKLNSYHAYDIIIEGRRLQAVCTEDKKLVIIDSRALGADLKQAKKVTVLYNSGYGNESKELDVFDIRSIAFKARV